jgi:hypothetical protein
LRYPTLAGRRSEGNAEGERERLQMSKTAWIVVIAIIVVALAALLYVLWRGIERRRRVAAMNPSERELYEAERQHEAAVARAEETLEKTEETWSGRVKKAEEAVSEAHSVGSRPLGSFGKIALFEDHIETPQGSQRFDLGRVEALVDNARGLADGREPALSRAGKEVLQELMSRGAGPDGMRAVYLLVETPIFVTVTEVREDDEAKARQFSHSINSAAAAVGSMAGEREQAVARAQAELDATVAARDAAVGAARNELASVKADTRRMDAARAGVRPSTPPTSNPGGPAAPAPPAS